MTLPYVSSRISDVSTPPPQLQDGVHGIVIMTSMGPDDKPYLITTVDQFRNQFGVANAAKNPHFVAIRRSLERGTPFMVQRLLPADATAATYSAWAAVNKITATAKTKGTWANSALGLTFTNASTMVLAITYAANTAIEETFTGATIDEIITAVNATSQLITLSTTSGYTAPPTNASPVYLTGGTDGAFADAAAKDTAINTQLAKFNDLVGLYSISAPGTYTLTTLSNLMNYATTRGDIRALFELDPASDPAAAITFLGTMTTAKSMYLACYYSSYQTVWSQDLSANVQIGCLFDVMSVHSSTLGDEKLYRAPAGGKRGKISGVVSYAYNMLAPARKAQADTLTNGGINMVGQHVKFGAVVWGADTRYQVAGSPLNAIHIVNMLIDLNQNLGAIYQGELFEPMDPVTWRIAWAKATPMLQRLQDNQVIYPGWAYIGDQDASKIEDARFNRLVDLQANKYKVKVSMVPVNYIQAIDFTLAVNGLSVQFQLGLSTK